MNDEKFNQLNQGAIDLEALKRLQEAFDTESAPTADYRDLLRQELSITPRELTALRLGIPHRKFVSWNKKVNRRRAKNKVARRSRAVNARLAKKR